MTMEKVYKSNKEHCAGICAGGGFDPNEWRAQSHPASIARIPME